MSHNWGWDSVWDVKLCEQVLPSILVYVCIVNVDIAKTQPSRNKISQHVLKMI